MADKVQKIIEIIIPTDDLVKRSAELQQAINDTKTRLKEADSEFKNGGIGAKEYATTQVELKAQIKALTAEQSVYTKEIQNNVTAQTTLEGSINQLKANLSSMTAEYYALSEAERKGAKGQELQKAINATTDELKEGEQSIQVYNRSVGNYENSIKNAIGANTGFLGTMVDMVQTQGGLAQGFKAATTAAANMGKQLLALAMNPVVAVLALIAVTIGTVNKVMKSSEDLTDRWSFLLAPLNRLFDYFVNVLQQAVGVITTFVEGGAALLGWIAKAAEGLPLVGDAMKDLNAETQKAIELEKAKDALDDKNRENIVLNAKDALEVAKLRSEATDKEKYTAAERMAMLQRAVDLEGDQMKRNKEFAAEKYRIALEESKRSQNTEAVNDELAKLYAESINAETEYYTGIRRLKSALLSAEQENAADIKAVRDKQVADNKERREKEQSAIRQYEDLILSIRKESADKQIAEATLAANRQIEDLKKRLTTEENLTKTARQAISNTILATEQKLAVDVAAIRDAASKEALQKETDRLVAENNIRLELATKGSQDEYNLKLESLRLQRNAEIASAEQTGVSIELINAKYRQKELDAAAEMNAAKKAAIEKEVAEADLRFQNELLKAGENEILRAELEQEQATAKLERLATMDAAEKALLFASEEAYTNAVLLAEQTKQEAIKKTSEVQRKARDDQFMAARAAISSILESYGVLAGNSEAFAAFSKAMALYDIGVNTAKGVSAAISSGAGVPFPGNLIAIASGVASVLAGIAQAKQVLSSSKIPKAPKFHDGGIVGGSGEVPATLLAGESVMNRAATAMYSPILSAMNMSAGGNAIQVGNIASTDNMDAFKAMFQAIFEEMPAPVVSVVEITDVTNRVKAIEESARI